MSSPMDAIARGPHPSLRGYFINAFLDRFYLETLSSAPADVA